MSTKDHWKFLGSDVPCGVDPAVDGQLCYRFRTGRGLNETWAVVSVRQFWTKGIEL